MPVRYTKDPQLGRWVCLQRAYYKNKELSEERIDRLDSVGFVWDPFDKQWMGMYQKLVAYKKQYRSTNVPCPYIGNWISKQRGLYKKNKLSDKRMELLNSINFVWSVRGYYNNNSNK